MRFKTIVGIPAATPANATFNGPAIPIGNMTALSSQFVVAGATTPSSTGKIQVSDDAPGDGTERGFVPTNWSDLPLATIPIAANGVFLTPVVNVCARWARLVYTYASGTAGTVVANLHAQGYGAG